MGDFLIFVLLGVVHFVLIAVVLCFVTHIITSVVSWHAWVHHGFVVVHACSLIVSSSGEQF